MPEPATTLPATAVHPTAIVGDGVQLGDGIIIGPYAIVGEGVILGDGCKLAGHASVQAGSTLGKRVAVHSFAVVGGEPQDLSFDPTVKSAVLLGNDVVVREGVTINRATENGKVTVIEDGVYLMANSHVAHDSRVGPRTVIANNVMVAGHVDIGPDVFLGGGTGIHQFARIGEGAMVSGNASVSYDVPPHTIAAERNGLIGLNLVGLRRRQAGSAILADLKNCFRAVFTAGDVRRNAAGAIEQAIAETDHGRTFLAFCAGGKRGFVRPRR